MSRTLGPINTVIEDNEQQNNKFYLNDQTPLFLHQSTGEYKKQDIKKCKQLIESLCDNQIKTSEQIDQISALIQQQNTLQKGMGYFAAKNMIFLEYQMLLKLYELFKINGKSLTQGNGLELYKRLAYLKTLMLKLNPVEKKLEYQKNKILKHAEKAVIVKDKKKDESQSENNQQEDQQNNQDEIQQQNDNEDNQNVKDDDIQQQDQMNFKPRPSTLMNIKKQKQIKLQRNDKYQAPKISSNLSKEDKIKQRFQKQKQRKKLGLIRRLQSDLIQGDHAEQKYLGDQINQKLHRKFNQKTNFEQQNMIRLPDSKKEKFYKKQMIRNSLRKNQLEEDFKEVQMVRKLFDEENQMGRKITMERKEKKIHKNQKGGQQRHGSHGFNKKNHSNNGGSNNNKKNNGKFRKSRK